MPTRERLPVLGTTDRKFRLRRLPEPPDAQCQIFNASGLRTSLASREANSWRGESLDRPLCFSGTASALKVRGKKRDP